MSNEINSIGFYVYLLDNKLLSSPCLEALLAQAWDWSAWYDTWYLLCSAHMTGGHFLWLFIVGCDQTSSVSVCQLKCLQLYSTQPGWGALTCLVMIEMLLHLELPLSVKVVSSAMQPSSIPTPKHSLPYGKAPETNSLQETLWQRVAHVHKYWLNFPRPWKKTYWNSQFSWFLPLKLTWCVKNLTAQHALVGKTSDSPALHPWFLSKNYWFWRVFVVATPWIVAHILRHSRLESFNTVTLGCSLD